MKRDRTSFDEARLIWSEVRRHHFETFPLDQFEGQAWRHTMDGWLRRSRHGDCAAVVRPSGVTIEYDDGSSSAHFGLIRNARAS